MSKTEKIFDNARKGDKVYCLLNGWGEIEDIQPNTERFQIQVRFEKDFYWYTYSGKFCDNKNQILFWQDFEIPKKAYEKPLHLDTPVWVWDDNKDKKAVGCFSHFNEEGKICAFMYGHTSKARVEAISWNNYELVGA